MIAITEPHRKGGVAALGARILLASLRRAGHAVDLVDPYLGSIGPAAAAKSRQVDGQITPVGIHDIPPPRAWFVSLLYARQFIDLPKVFRGIGVAMYAHDRGKDAPLVVFGGQAMIAPAPVEDFADVIALGDGELTGGALAELLSKGWSKADILDWCHGRPGYYVPGRGGRLVRAESPTVTCELVRGKNTSIIEIARGCRGKCPYCAIGWANGKYREVDQDSVRRAIRASNGRTVNTFAPDFSSVTWAEEISGELAAAGCYHIGVDAKMSAAMKGQDARKQYAFGVEGLSERLRTGLGKPIPNSMLVDSMTKLVARGASFIRWYLILGLPGETDDDLEEMLEVLDAAQRATNDDAFFTVTLSLLQPVPHTPMARVGAAPDEARRRGDRIHDLGRAVRERCGRARLCAASMKGIQTNDHEVWLGRSPQSVSCYIEQARGSHIATGAWREEARSLGAYADEMTGPIAWGAATPWDHVDVGVKQSTLRKGWEAYCRRVGISPDIEGHDPTHATTKHMTRADRLGVVLSALGRNPLDLAMTGKVSVATVARAQDGRALKPKEWDAVAAGLGVPRATIDSDGGLRQWMTNRAK